MLHIWTPDRFATAAAASDHLGADAPSVEDLRRNNALDDNDEYEFVLGQRQAASWCFVLLVLISVFAGISYLAGRATVAHANTSAPPSVPAVQAPAARSATASPAAPAAAAPAAALVTAGAAAPEVKVQGSVSTDLFTTPISGAMYIQTAAVERGIAAIMAEGIRTHGLPALVAPGPNDKIFRVLVGPFPNAAAYQQAKVSLELIGLSAFAQFQK